MARTKNAGDKGGERKLRDKLAPGEKVQQDKSNADRREGLTTGKFQKITDTFPSTRGEAGQGDVHCNPNPTVIMAMNSPPRWC